LKFQTKFFIAFWLVLTLGATRHRRLRWRRSICWIQRGAHARPMLPFPQTWCIYIRREIQRALKRKFRTQKWWATWSM